MEHYVLLERFHGNVYQLIKVVRYNCDSKMSFLCRKLEYYGENTNLHALRYVADKSRHPCFRAMWLMIFVVSTAVMMLVISGAYDTYRYNAISFVTETTYLDWNTTFPAVTICEISNSDVFWTPYV